MGFEKKNVRAVDFGSAAFYDEPTKKLSGTPLYAAPEIIKVRSFSISPYYKTPHMKFFCSHHMHLRNTKIVYPLFHFKHGNISDPGEISDP